MKDSKDFDVNRFVPDGSTTETTVAGGSAQQSKRSVLIATSEPDEPIPLSAQAVTPRQTALTEPKQPIESTLQTGQAQSTQHTQPIPPTQQRTSTRQRKATLDEYLAAFMYPPKITDRQPVFVSRDIRDRIDGIVRRFGERKMSVSGFLENLARHHLEDYADDLEQWRRL